MNRSFPIRWRLPVLCLTGLLSLCSMTLCRAQFSRFEHPNTAPYSISPLATLLGSINNVVYSSHDANGSDATWDPARHHYRGNLLSYLYYPELPQAGYSRFSVIRMERHHINLDHEPSDMSVILEQTEAAAGRDDRRAKLSYHYDASGWLRAIIRKSIHPEYEAYTESTDSFFYSFLPDSSVRIRWQEDEHSSGAGYAATSDCGPMPPFHHIYRHRVVSLTLDPYRQITDIDSRTDELWDTCTAGGPKIWRRRLSYDHEGKLVYLTDSSAPYPAPTFEYAISYETMPYERFAGAVQALPAFAPLSENLISSHLSRQRDLTAMRQRITTKSFLHYDSKARRQVLRSDSPQVRVDSAYYVINAARERVVYVAPGRPRTFSFHARGKDSGSGPPLLRVQNLPGPPEPSASPAVICDPLALSTTYTQSRAIKSLGGERLIVFSTDEAGDRYGGYSTLSGGLRFDPAPPRRSPARIRSMALQDARGLVKYLWLPDHAYKLEYR